MLRSRLLRRCCAASERERPAFLRGRPAERPAFDSPQSKRPAHRHKIPQEDATNTNDTNRAAYRIDVPGPVKDTILQYLNTLDDDDASLLSSSEDDSLLSSSDDDDDDSSLSSIDRV